MAESAMSVQYSPRNPPVLTALVVGSVSPTRPHTAHSSAPKHDERGPFESSVEFKQVKEATKDADGSCQAPVLSNVGISGDFAIARYFAHGRGLYLHGTVQEKCQMEQWLDFTQTVASRIPEHAAAFVEKYLATRTYLVGYRFSLADIALATTFRATSNVASMLQDAVQYPSLSRWYKLVQSRVDFNVVQAYQNERKKAEAIAQKQKGGSSQNQGGSGAGGKSKKPPKAGYLPGLVGAKEGEVVTRFPPEPSGYLHIGHVKAVILNHYYARYYKGKLVLRFDDTNPIKEKAEYEDSIIEDLARLDIVPDRVSHTSDFFPEIIEYARKLLRDGNAYADDTLKEQMRQERMDGIESSRRKESIENNLQRFEQMLQGGEEGLKWCLRAKIDMKNKNKALRDPVIFRCQDQPHSRTGNQYKAYPTYDFSCPIVDSIEGITHVTRTTEFKDRDPQYTWIQERLGLRKCEFAEFARMNFEYTVLSKRKLTKLVDDGHVEGWNDPRFPTVQGCLRRGMQVEALKEFILAQGASTRVVDMEWDKFWATNKKIIDPSAGRYSVVSRDYYVPVELYGDGLPLPIEYRSAPLHPQNKAAGTKMFQFGRKILLEGGDVEMCKEGEEVTLMKWGNAIIRSIEKDSVGRLSKVKMELHLDGDFKKTEKKLTWVTETDQLVSCHLIEYDVLVTKPKMEEDDNVKDFINPQSRSDSYAIGEAALANLEENAFIQLERRGYYRVDRPYMGPNKPIVLFQIPDGKRKNMSHLTSNIQRVEVAQYDAKVKATKERKAAAKQKQ
eukprot:gb/GECG01010234.1/.p1 GENE.gb/GECG01010234.1/~~gb/GECG01010234.1/.p1  ORF type:complete len:784 (+),score=108.32 gb/GECG01010234.1/:1-2352(+)